MKRISAIEFAVPLIFFFVFFIHSVTLGMTDDEAYYWALSLRPDWGFAYHPPMVVWMIWFTRNVLGPLFGEASSIVVRFPSVLISSLMLAIALRSLKKVVLPENHLKAALCFLSMAGVFAFSWMMVPDIPFLLGTMLLFSASMDVAIDQPEENEKKTRVLWKLFIGASLSLMSKFTAVFPVVSTGAVILLFQKNRAKLLLALFFGSILGGIPPLIWNIQNDFYSVMYQLQNRHHGGNTFHLMRGLRFLLIQLVAVGPILFFLSLGKILWPFKWRSAGILEKLVLLWALPPFLVFFIQPFFSDFKPHWAIIFWIPMGFYFAVKLSEKSHSFAYKFHTRYGLGFLLIGILFIRFPITTFLAEKFTGKELDARFDLSNDLLGWETLPEFLKTKVPDFSAEKYTVVGSRYQTASRAAYATWKSANVVLLPRPHELRAEWAEYGVTDSIGPDWPKLMKPIIFVADNRYTSPPEFRDSKCESLGKDEVKRGERVVRWVEAWLCKPHS